MTKSEMSLLRKEIAKLAAEIMNLRKENSEIKATLNKKITLLEVENDRLNLEIAARDRLLEGRYENSDSPSSTNSRYNAERAAYRKKNCSGDDDDDKRGGGDGSTPARRGPPAGHKGASHKNRAEKTVTLRVCKCPNCGSRRLDQLPPRVKTVCDFAGDGSMRVACVAYVVEGASCRRCGSACSGPEPTLPGTSLGPRALGFVEEYYAKRSTDHTISYYFGALYGFGISPNAVWNARKALADRLKGAYRKILARISESPFIQFDESVLKGNGKKRYAWLVTTGEATYIVVAPGRGGAVLDIHFPGLLGKPVVVDGYTVYNMFPVKQRCWVHLLRKAEKLAVRAGGRYETCYRRLLAMYRSVKGKKSAGCAECRDLERTVLEIAAAYGNHKFGGTLENAAPCMFTFLRHPGMPPHNNAAELEIRDTVVLHRNVRHQLTNALGLEVFSIMISVARTCHKQGIVPRLAVEELIRDPDWDIFKPPDAERAKLAAVPMAA